MKKVWLMMFAVLFLAPVSFADNWGVGVKLGIAENDPKAMKDLNDSDIPFNRELDENGGFFSLEALHEWNLAETDKVGVKLGLDFYGENELKIQYPRFEEKYKETTFAVPLTVYYKKDNGVKNWSYFAGAGLTYIYTNWEISGASDENKGKVFPHITAGAEYRFTEVFALGLDLRYNFSAKVKKDGVVMSDRSGFGGALAGRFYF